MIFLPGDLPGVIIIEPDIHRDGRGYFLETYEKRKYEKGGITAAFVQDNSSRSCRGTIRGLHFQVKHAQGKLVRVMQGEVFDAAVDIRRNSPTFGKWCGILLSSENFRQVYIPPGFAHGFCVTSEMAEIEYKCTDYYYPDDEITVLWNDPKIGIAWPMKALFISEKDGQAKPLAELVDKLPKIAKK